jgi:hypothetical protein
MSRRPLVIPTTRLEVRIPEDLRTQLDLYLWSELEGRVPHAKYQEFFISRIKEFFEQLRRRQEDAKS